jgi:hypothetical protein
MSHHYYRDGLFDPASPYNRDQCLTPYIHLRDRFRELGIKTHTADFLFSFENLGRTNVYFSLGTTNNYQRVARRQDTILSGFFALECPINAPTMYRRLPKVERHFRRVYSYSDAVSLKPFVGSTLNLRQFHIPQPFEAPLEKYWRNKDRNLMVLINANKSPRLRVQELYAERLRALEHFALNGGIDLYGFGWDRLPYLVGYGRISGRLMDLGRAAWERVTSRWYRRYGQTISLTYRGVVESKYATLARYRFAICFENMVLPGWVTEKIFDCFFSGTIPIYLGAPDIEQCVPQDCYIDMRQFSNYKDLAEFLRSLEQKDIDAYREHARDYLKSETFRLFSKESFAEHFLQAVEKDTGIRL